MKNRKLFINQLLRLNVFLFPFLVTVTVVLIGLESATYPGFVVKNIFLDPIVLFVLVIFLGFFAVAAKETMNVQKSWLEFYHLLFQLNKLFIPALLILGYTFISIEARNYRGYVYTQGFHFDPYYFFYFFAISFLLLFLDFLNSVYKKNKIYKENKRGKLGKRQYLSLLMVLIFLVLTAKNLYDDSIVALPKFLLATENPLADTNFKMRFLYRDFYDFMQFVKKNTPTNAVIMRMPQQGTWPTLSNDGYVRWFLYPRYTIAGDDNTLGDSRIKYVFIHRAYDRPRVDQYIGGWPTFKVPAKRILYMRDNDFTKEPIIITGDYDPQDKTYEDLWGLIELKEK